MSNSRVPCQQADQTSRLDLNIRRINLAIGRKVRTGTSAARIPGYFGSGGLSVS